MPSIDKLIIKNLRLFHVIRMTLVCVIAVVIGALFALPYSAWAPITIIVVMASDYAGAVVDKANQRIVGTIIGAACGLSLYLLPATYAVTHYVLLIAILAIFLFFTLGKYSYSAILASITFVLVAGNGPSELHVAAWRTFNVIWGALLAMAASKWLFAAKASYHFKLLTQDFLIKFQDIYQQHNQQMQDEKAYQRAALAELETVSKKLSSIAPSAIQEESQLTQTITEITALQVRMFNLLENMVKTPWSHQYGSQKIKHCAGLFESKQQTVILIKQLADYIDESDKALPPFVISPDDLSILQLFPKIEDDHEVKTDISYYGYLWLNRELARQVIAINHEINQLVKVR